MTGTMSSLNNALTALRYQRVAMDVASNNIANVSTEGYVRRRAEAQSLGGPAQVAMWSRYDGVGDGVTAAATSRLSDAFLDARARGEHGTQAYLDTRVSVLDRLEGGVGEPGPSGVAAALASFRSAWQDLQTHPDQEASRGQVLAAGQSLADAINAQSSNFTTEAAGQRGHLLDVVSEANGVAQQLAATNKSLADAAGTSVDVNDLLDQRDQLALRLSELTGGVATARSDGGFDVSVGGQSLVSGRQAATLAVTGGIAADGTATGTPLAFGVVTASGVAPVSAVGGEAGGVAQLLTTTIPDYLSGLGEVAQQLADAVNAVHSSGYDENGDPGTAFFSYDPSDPAGTLGVAITDTHAVVTSSSASGTLDGNIADAIGQITVADGPYQRLVNGLGSEVASSKRLSTTQQLLTSQVDGSREQLTGVNLDEETVNLVAAQRAYEAASRVMSTMDSMLDTLINHTGLVG